MRVLFWNDVARADEFCHFAFPQFIRTQTVKLHTHGDFHEFFWVHEGCGVHGINGRSYELSPGSLVFVRKEDHHGVTITSVEALRKVNIAFPCEIWTEFVNRYTNSIFSYCENLSEKERHFQIPLSILEELLMSTSSMREGNLSRVSIDRFLLNLGHLLEQQKRKKAYYDLPDWLAKACDEIKSPVHFRNGTKGFTKLAGRCPEHVSREIYRYTRRTPTEVVNDARMEYAALHLRTTSKPILEISLDCGIQNLGHFYKLFNSKFKMSPRKYRLKHQRTVHF